jgi:hypothetical protein
MYKLIRGTLDVLHIVEGKTIPADPRNADFQQFVRWRDGWVERRPDGMDVFHEPNVPMPADPAPAPSKDEIDTADALAYAKLRAMRDMTPAEVGAWVDANVTNFAQAKDAIRTLAIGFCVLIRKL